MIVTKKVIYVSNNEMGCEEINALAILAKDQYSYHYDIEFDVTVETHVGWSLSSDRYKDFHHNIDILDGFRRECTFIVFDDRIIDNLKVKSTIDSTFARIFMCLHDNDGEFLRLDLL